jgi:WhiB family redox-sensing transcriptional regulator
MQDQVSQARPLHSTGGDWRSRAECRDVEPELFFPEESSPRWKAAAKRVCTACDVRAECLDWALGMREPFGVWGGLDEDERMIVLARRRPALDTARGAQAAGQ